MDEKWGGNHTASSPTNFVDSGLELGEQISSKVLSARGGGGGGTEVSRSEKVDKRIPSLLFGENQDCKKICQRPTVRGGKLRNGGVEQEKVDEAGSILPNFGRKRRWP